MANKQRRQLVEIQESLMECQAISFRARKLMLQLMEEADRALLEAQSHLNRAMMVGIAQGGPTTNSAA